MASLLPAARYAATVCFILFSSSCYVDGDVNTQSESDFSMDEMDWYNMPSHGSFSQEFKFEIAPGKTECFYQPMLNGSQLFITYEILTGGDRNIDFIFRNEQLEVLVHTPWKPEGAVEQHIETRGIYEMCFDNSYSRFASKLVYFYMSVYVQEHWEDYIQDIEDVHETVANFSVSLEVLQQNIQQAVIHQTSSRMYGILDYYTIMGNNKYVQLWSIMQCVVIIMSTCLQVFFVRRLFKSTNVTPTMKPRA